MGIQRGRQHAGMHTTTAINIQTATRASLATEMVSAELAMIDSRLKSRP